MEVPFNSERNESRQHGHKVFQLTRGQPNHSNSGGNNNLARRAAKEARVRKKGEGGIGVQSVGSVRSTCDDVPACVIPVVR